MVFILYEDLIRIDSTLYFYPKGIKELIDSGFKMRTYAQKSIIKRVIQSGYEHMIEDMCKDWNTSGGLDFYKNFREVKNDVSIEV